MGTDRQRRDIYYRVYYRVSEWNIEKLKEYVEDYERRSRLSRLWTRHFNPPFGDEIVYRVSKEILTARENPENEETRETRERMELIREEKSLLDKLGDLKGRKWEIFNPSS